MYSVYHKRFSLILFVTLIYGTVFSNENYEIEMKDLSSIPVYMIFPVCFHLKVATFGEKN